MFEARNTAGAVVATHRTLTYGLLASGSVTVSSDPKTSTNYNRTGAAPVRSQLDSNVRYANFGLAVNHLVAFRPRYNTQVGIGYDPDGNRAFVGVRNPANPAGQVEPVVDYWVFGPAGSARSSAAGIEIYNADGSVAMADTQKPMKIAGISAIDATGVPGVTSGVASSYAMCYGVPIATASPGPAYSSIDGGFFYTERAPMYGPPSANGFSGGGTVATQVKFSNDSGFYGYNTQRLTAMLIDVQGL